MTLLKKLNELLPILYPEFFVVTDDDNNELVFLKTGDMCDFSLHRVADKTQCEAVMNHFHIFGHISENNYDLLEEAGKKIASNLLKSLNQTFPQKKFIVYLEVNTRDSTIIRFHQVWKNEFPYIDTSTIYKNTKIFEYRN